VVRQARQGQCFTVLYRSRVAFEIVPPAGGPAPGGGGMGDALYRARPVGASSGGQAAAKHDHRADFVEFDGIWTAQDARDFRAATAELDAVNPADWTP
jgi:hypothetical protein